MHDAIDIVRPDLRTHFDHLVRNIRAGNETSAEELCRLLTPGVRFFLTRSIVPAQVDEIARDVLLCVIKGIREQELHEPARLLKYVRAVVQLRICGAGLEHRKPARQEVEDGRVAAALRRLSGRDHEMLKRFYVLRQSEQQILTEMQLDCREFRELKSAVRTELARIKENSPQV